jgi:hypothetical protein
MASADVIELKDGGIIEGDITEKTDQFIAIETASGTSFIKVEEISEIRKTPADIATGTVIEVTGSVERLPKGEEQWTPIQKDTVLNEGDKVRTGPDSKAIAIFADQLIMAVEPESNLGLDKLQKSRKKDVIIKANLDRGQIWNDVGKLKTKESKFFVTTPQAVTGARGTVFTVQAGPDEKTTVAVVDGGVEVRTRDMMMEPIQVEKNQMTEVTRNRPPTAPTAISAVFLAQWAVYQAQFGALHGGLGAQGFQMSPTQATVAGAAVAAGVGVTAAAGGGGGGSDPVNTVTVTASMSGNYSEFPVDREIDGSSALGGRTVTSVDVRVLCDPLTIPDQFQIIYMGSVIGDTGVVGAELGDPSVDIPLNASADGSSAVVTIRVRTGELGTDWNWDATLIYYVE